MLTNCIRRFVHAYAKWDSSISPRVGILGIPRVGVHNPVGGFSCSATCDTTALNVRASIFCGKDVLQPPLKGIVSDT
jgi:hypothetical protein